MTGARERGKDYALRPDAHAMPTLTTPRRREAAAGGRRHWTLAYLVAAGVGVVALFAIVTSPVASLLGESNYAIPSALHGVASIVYLIVGTVCAYMAYLLYAGRLEAYRDLRILAGLQAFFSLVTILFGNWIYIYYRVTGGPRSYFLETRPEIHQIFFEFKEFVALFTLPLSVAAAFILWTRGDDLKQETELREVVAVLLALTWLAIMLTFGLGAAITKLRSV